PRICSCRLPIVMSGMRIPECSDTVQPEYPVAMSCAGELRGAAQRAQHIIDDRGDEGWRPLCPAAALQLRRAASGPLAIHARRAPTRALALLQPGRRAEMAAIGAGRPDRAPLSHPETPIPISVSGFSSFAYSVRAACSTWVMRTGSPAWAATKAAF